MESITHGFKLHSEFAPTGDQPQAIEALRGLGWVISGAGHAVASDYETHTGRGFTAGFVEN